jgi:hypothetical protein
LYVSDSYSQTAPDKKREAEMRRKGGRGEGKRWKRRMRRKK